MVPARNEVMKRFVQALTFLTLVLMCGQTAFASDSSFILNGTTALEGGGLSLSLSTNHFGKATSANFYLSHYQPLGSLKELKKGFSIGKLKMNPGAMTHNLIITPEQVKALGTPNGVAVYVAAYWPKFSHFWGQRGRSKQSFRFRKLKAAPKTSNTRGNRRKGKAKVSRVRPKPLAPRMR